MATKTHKTKSCVYIILLLIYANPYACEIQYRGGKTSPELVSVNLPGDIIIGGLFPVHEKGENTPCGPKIYNRGVHRLEAMLYAVDRVNNDSTLLPGITIGVHILDTCSRDTYALNQSLQFVRSSLNNMDTSAFECQDLSTPQLRRNTTGPVFGVIGGSYSSVSLQVANLLRLFHIPQISPASTAKTLSDKTRFDLFARTVPPDTFQSVAMVDIIKCFNWSYVSTIHSEGSYGEYGIEAFHKEATERNVCIAAAEKVPSSADDKVFDGIISKLQKKPNARGVVLFVRAEDARRLLQAAKRADLAHPFHWIASDGWGKQQKLLDGLEDIAEGAITVELQSELIQDFDNYMMSLSAETNTRNPWFAEYWEDTFDCTLTKNLPVPVKDRLGMRECDKKFRLSEKVGFQALPDETPDTITNYCLKSLKDLNISSEKLAAFCGDNTNTYFGGAQRIGLCNVFYKLKTELKTEIEGVSCPVHILHNSQNIAIDYIEKWESQLNYFKSFDWMNLTKFPECIQIEESISYLNEKGESIKVDHCFPEFIHLNDIIIENIGSKEWKPKNSSERWVQVFATDKSHELKQFKKICQYIFNIPGHNATVERVFSIMFSKWKYEQKRLGVDTVEAILQ